MENLWLIKDKKGRIFGPYSDKEVCFHIEEGEFKGEELFSKYPAGKWKPLSSHPVFYEKILSQLNQTDDPSSSFSTQSADSGSADKEPIEPTRILAPKPDSPKKEKIKIKLSKEFKKEILEEEGFDDIIEMEDVNKKFLDRLIDSIKTPVLILTALITVFLFAYFFNSNEPSQPKGEFVRLSAPSRNNSSVDSKEAQAKAKQAFAFYAKGTISNYLRAQNLYVQSLESKIKPDIAYMFLCLTHLELWPFAYQDTKDKQTVKKTLSLAKKFNKNTDYTDICKAVKALIDKKFEQVLMIANRLFSASTEVKPIFLYYLKAKALNNLNKQKEASSYLQSIFMLETKWIAPYMLQADIHYRNKNYEAAGVIYQKILTLFKDHPSAKLRFGILEYKFFKNIKKSEQLLKSVLNKLNDWIEPDILFEAYITLANIYLQKNEKKLAVKYSNSAYALDPSHPEMIKLKTKLKDETNFENTKIKAQGLIYKGDFLVSQGNCPDAKIEYEKAYKASRNGQAALKLAQCYWQTGASGQAIRWLKRAINADRQLLEAYFLLSDYLSSLFDFESAMEILNSVKKIYPSNSDLFKAYALLSFRQKHYKSTIAYAERALQFYTFDIEVYILLSQSYLAIGKGAKAFSYAEKAIEENVNNIQAQIAYARALDLANEKYNTEQYLKEQIKNFPAVIEYQQALGEYYFNKDEYQQAQTEFENIISSYPKFKSAYTYLGKIHKILSLKNNSRQDYKQAINYFVEATLLDVSDPNSIFHLGEAYLEHEDYQAAENEFEKVLQLNSNYPMIHYYIGLVNYHQTGEKNMEKALKFAKIQSAKNPHNYLPYKLAGDIYKLKSRGVFENDQEKKNSYELCAKEYQKALKYLKKSLEVSMSLLECYKKSGNLDLALQLARQLTKEKGLSGHPAIYREIGLILEQKEEYETAKTYYANYFKLSPGAKDRKEIETRIEKLIKEKLTLTTEQKNETK